MSCIRILGNQLKKHGAGVVSIIMQNINLHLSLPWQAIQLMYHALFNVSLKLYCSLSTSKSHCTTMSAPM